MSGVKFLTVTNSIAALSVANLTIKDVDEVDEQWQVRGSVLYPLIDNFLNFAPPVRQTYGINGAEKKDIKYTLHYRLLYAPVGSERGVKQIYNGLLTMIVNLLNAVINDDDLTGAVDIQPRIASGNSIVTDPAGNRYYGANIDFDVLEFYEV